MTFSISAAMTLRRVKSALLKMVRKMRSVSRCWMSISSTAASARFGLIERRARSAKSAKARMKRWLVLRSRLDDFDEAAGKFRHALLKLADGALPLVVGGRGVAEEKRRARR